MQMQSTLGNAAGGGSPGGSNTQIQFNDSNAFGGDSNLIWNNTSKTLSVGTTLLTKSALSAPATPTVTPTCTVAGMETCATTYSYFLVAKNLVGDTGAADQSVTVTITNGPDTLTASNFNTVGTTAQAGTTGIEVWNLDPNFPGLLSTITAGTSLVDDGSFPGNNFNGPLPTNTTQGIYGLARFRLPSPGDTVGGQWWGSWFDEFSTHVQNNLLFSAPTIFAYHGPMTNGEFAGYQFTVENTTAGGTKAGVNFDVSSTANVTELRGLGVAGYNVADAVDVNLIWSHAYLSGPGTFTNLHDYWAGNPSSSGHPTNLFGFYSEALTKGTNNYSFWSDEQGVFRIRSDSSFDSVAQAIPALYNPQFTKYTAGAPRYERVILGEWNGNVSEMGNYAGGTGTARDFRLLGPTIHFGSASHIADTTFTGAGLDDGYYNGTYTGATHTYCAIIDATGTPDTFKWGTNGGCDDGATGVAITGANQTLSAGVVIKFAATTGHTATNKWSVVATAAADYGSLSTSVAQMNALKTTGAATGKTVVCVDTSTGQLYASSSGVACAN